MEFIRDNNMYPLWQPQLLIWHRSNPVIRKVYKTAKPTTKENWYQKLGHINHNDIAKIPEIATEISFMKDSISITEREFCQACI